MKTYRKVISGTGKITYKFPVDVSDYDYVVCPVVSIPKSYYSQPNEAILTVNDEGVDYDLTFSVGIYSYSSMRTILQSKLQTVNANFTVTTPNKNTEPTTGKYTITITGNTLQPSITTTDKYLARQLGIERNTVYEFSGDSFESVNFCNFQPYTEILVKSNIMENHERILQEVYSSASVYNKNIDFETNDRATHRKKIIKGLGVNYVAEFYLETVDNESINLNGNEWSVSIVLFKESKLEENIKEYIKFKMEEALQN